MRSQSRTRAREEAGRVRRYARAAHSLNETHSEPHGLCGVLGSYIRTALPVLDQSMTVTVE